MSDIKELFNKHIQSNKAQLDAVTRAFAEKHFFLIQGPPGTGKTTVIKELILQQLRLDPAAKILVVSQANVAVDNVLRGITELNIFANQSDRFQIVRCGTPDRIAQDMEEYSFEKRFEVYEDMLHTCPTSDKKVKSLREKWLQIIDDKNSADIVGGCLLSCFRIIGATCVGLENRHYGLSNVEFDLVIIDEAGKALAGELLIPINRAQKVVIIGDHKQLPPVIDPALYKDGAVEYDDVVEDKDLPDFLNRSFFQRLYEDCPDYSKCMLNIQFRMPPVIADLVNIFYDGTLETGENCRHKKPMFLGNHLIFVDMKDIPEYKEETLENGKKTGPFNKKEAEAAASVIEKIRVYYTGRIVVITPYKMQKSVLKREFEKRQFEDVWVNTIDAFQGDEENIVIFCTTRAVRHTKYFSDNARLNVAFSRAKNTLIFLGSSTYLKRRDKGDILRRIGDYLESKAAVIPYEKWLSSDFDIGFDPSYEEAGLISNDTKNALPISSDFFDMINSEFVKEHCEVCGTELSEVEHILCMQCFSKCCEPYKCSCCGKKINFSYYEKYVLRALPPDLCSDCDYVTCSSCSQTFAIRNVRRNKLMEEGKSPICDSCREKMNAVDNVLCPICSQPFTIKTEFHKTLKAGGKKPICDSCREKMNAVDNVICPICSQPFTIKTEFHKTLKAGGKKPICDSCREKMNAVDYVTCSNCSKTFAIKTEFHKILKADGKNPICDSCKEKMNETVFVGECRVCGKPIKMKRFVLERKNSKFIEQCMHTECSKRLVKLPWKCNICGVDIYLSEGEKYYYENNRLELPKKCKECRQRQNQWQ